MSLGLRAQPAPQAVIAGHCRRHSLRAFVPSSSFLRFPPSAILSPAVSFWPVEPSRPTTDHGVDMANEADTCRQFVVPKRQARVDRLKALQAQTAAERDALLPAILDRAFKGEL